MCTFGLTFPDDPALSSAPLQQIGLDIQPTRGLIEPKQSCALTVVLRATRELRLDGVALSADVRGGRPAKVRGLRAA